MARARRNILGQSVRQQALHQLSAAAAAAAYRSELLGAAASCTVIYCSKQQSGLAQTKQPPRALTCDFPRLSPSLWHFHPFLPPSFVLYVSSAFSFFNEPAVIRAINQSNGLDV